MEKKNKRLCNYGLVPSGKTLEEMLDCYCKNYRPVLTEYLNIFREYDLTAVIHYATGAICPCCGKRHPHQRRLSRMTLDEFAEKLLAQIGQIEKAKDFEALYKLVCDAKIWGIGPVTLYDSALRISAKLSILPKKIVYFHRQAVIPQRPGLQQLEISRFAPPFARKKMTAFEIEEFLCCFHDFLVEHRITLLR